MKLNINTETDNIQDINNIVDEVQNMPLASSVDINVNVEIIKPNEHNKIGFNNSGKDFKEAWDGGEK